MSDELLIYGSYGYTGSLITERLLQSDSDHSVVLAGRRAEPVERQATEHGLDHRVFSLEHPEIVEREIEECAAVLNCAGPFSQTAMELVQACLDTGTDYIDISGEIDVLESIAEHDRDAENAGVSLLPAAGFDVVPTDCLAAYLEMKLPTATHLTLGLDGLGSYSPGTLKSIIEGLARPGAIRENGTIRPVSAAWNTRELDFGDGPQTAITIPWGDVSTAYYTTGVPNIETYATVPTRAVPIIKRTRRIVPLLGRSPIQWGLKTLVDLAVSGPSRKDRSQGTCRIVGIAEDEEGNSATARLYTPNAYELTVQTAAEITKRTLSGDISPGFQTPASAFGTDFILEFDGVEREDLSESSERVAEPNP